MGKTKLKREVIVKKGKSKAFPRSWENSPLLALGRFVTAF